MKRLAKEYNQRPLAEPGPEITVPGLARVDGDLRRAFPLLSPEAIARILRMPVPAGIPEVEAHDVPKGHNTPDE